MIIISVGGGLGNQMFEYSFYYKMKHLYPEVEIKLDIMNTFGFAHNGYEIEEIFGLHAKQCTLEELKKVSDIYPMNGQFYKLNKFIEKIRHKLWGIKPSCKIQTDATAYEESFFDLDIERSYYLFGVFANYRFFSDLGDEIQSMYTFPPIIDEKNKLWKSKIISTESVSIHVRRGDYLEWGIDLVPDVFYRNAMKFIQEKKRNAELHFFVFTDDAEYVRENYYDIKNLYVVEGNTGKESYRDMQLMSLCKHNIIANSTFSFWGAYLNRNMSKIVIAPNLPYTGCKIPFACDDWVVMDV